MMTRGTGRVACRMQRSWYLVIDHGVNESASVGRVPVPRSGLLSPCPELPVTLCF